ncbi:hypothetical protein KS18_14835 [Photorhabdus luminescens]|nr:hypothetical protein KS18_14835 [Photorhabdus luminescens]
MKSLPEKLNESKLKVRKKIIAKEWRKLLNLLNNMAHLLMKTGTGKCNLLFINTNGAKANTVCLLMYNATSLKHREGVWLFFWLKRIIFQTR